jgi:hypothetical protein
VKGQGVPLLGRDLLSKVKLDWLSICNNIQCKQPNDLDKVLNQYNLLFSETLGCMKNFTAKIYIKPDSQPKFSKARNIPFALQEAVNAELERLEKEGIIRSVSNSEWASPIVIVPKPDGRIRICADYKKTVNPVVVPIHYPLPTAEELFIKMQGGQKFSKLDLTTAYLQIELDENSREYLVINTPKGLKEFLRMPYGISPASAIFQRKLENELKNVPMTVVKIDDILISGKNDSDHLNNLTKVLDII